MRFKKTEFKLAVNSLTEVTSGAIDAPELAPRLAAVCLLRAELAPRLEQDLPSEFELPLNGEQLELVRLSLAACIEYFGHWDSWDFPVRMGAWPAEAQTFLERLGEA